MDPASAGGLGGGVISVGPEVTVAETPAHGSRETVSFTQLGPATAVSWLLDNRDPAGTEHVDSSSVTGPPTSEEQGGGGAKR